MHQIDKNNPLPGARDTGGEKARLVELCAGQIVAAIEEANRDIDALSGAVMDAARHAHALLLACDEFDSVPAEESVAENSKALQKAVRDSSTRLQFADRLNQRLSNVSQNLASLAEYMDAAESPVTETRWTALLEKTRATFTMEQERQMFDAVFESSAVGAGTASATSPEPILFNGESRDDR